MNPAITVSVYQVVGSPLCVASGDGELVFERIRCAIEAGRSVNISFKYVTALMPPFINTAIGQLYGTFDEEQIRSRIKFVDIERSDLKLLIAALRMAKCYFKNKEAFDEAIRYELGEDESEE